MTHNFIFLISIIIGFVFTSEIVWGQSLNDLTDDKSILQALTILKETNQTSVLDRLHRNKVKIEFYDLISIDHRYVNHFAINSYDEDNNVHILINSNLKYSPYEALASLIAHESMHELPQSTVVEEQKAIMEEVRVWKILKSRVPEKYNDDRLVQRLNRLSIFNY